MKERLQPKLSIDNDAGQVGSACVCIRNLDPDLIVFLDGQPQADHLLTSVFRVRVLEADPGRCEDIPDVLGHYQLLQAGVRFIPRFPFESGVRYRASFDFRPLRRTGYPDVLTLDFSLPGEVSTGRTEVTAVFPSGNVLPENLLRFHVCFSNPMRRGQAEEQIMLLGPDGQPAPDTLYRAPLELWDKSMRYLSILLDPGRLKRWVGPNRELGPPLKAGQRYTLVIGAGMADASGRTLRQRFHKPFLVARAVRESVAVAHWKILRPASKSTLPVEIVFPAPLDWSLLWHAITIAPEGEMPIRGRIAIDQGERLWRFTPASPWGTGPYIVRVASDLEDVCGNGLLAAFDRPLRSGSGLTIEKANCSIPFNLEP